MKAVITVVGKDNVGILARVAGECAKYQVNIVEVSQTILNDLFCMIMIGDAARLPIEFGVFADRMREIGEALGMSIQVMHEGLFESMHRI